MRSAGAHRRATAGVALLCLLLSGCGVSGATPDELPAAMTGPAGVSPTGVGAFSADTSSADTSSADRASGSPQSAALPSAEAPSSIAVAPDAPVVGVLLATGGVGARWSDADRTAIERAFAARGLLVDIRSGPTGSDRLESYAQLLVDAKVSALVVASPADESGSTAISVAKRAGIPVIELDHLTPGGGADFYVGPDPIMLGQVLGEGLLSCLRRVGVDRGSVTLLNGLADDPAAAIMKDQYQAAVVGAGLQILNSVDLPDDRLAPDGALIGELLAPSGAELAGVIAASDAAAAAAAGALAGGVQPEEPMQRTVPIVGVGSSPAALQRVLTGEQCLTAFTSASAEVDAAASLASAVISGDLDAVAGLATGRLVDRGSAVEVRSVLLQPQPIFAADVPQVVAAGLVSASSVCASPEGQAACARAGIPSP